MLLAAPQRSCIPLEQRQLANIASRFLIMTSPASFPLMR
jgi:hypothetical protein